MSDPTPTLALETLGWDAEWEARFADARRAGYLPARVAIEDKQRYIVLGSDGERRARIAGRFRHSAGSTADLPKVGDWVALRPVPAPNDAVIEAVLPRRTKLSRKIKGREALEQVLVANVDLIFVVQALDATFNRARLERVLVMVHEGGARAAVVLNKSDVAEARGEKVAAAHAAAGKVPVVVASAVSGRGLRELQALIHAGETVAFIGTSGVGKSSLINLLYGEEVQATTEVRETDFKGRHTTTWREMLLLPGGGIVIDTPGMREFHMWLAGQGLGDAFPDIAALVCECRFRDCTHTGEADCAVRAAVADGRVPEERYDHYLKLQRELAYLEEVQQKRTWMDRKRRASAGREALRKFGLPPEKAWAAGRGSRMED